MTAADTTGGFDIRTESAVQRRFGLETLDYCEDDARAVTRLALAGMRNPVTNVSSLAPIAVLVDDAGSKATYACRGQRWPVTSDLNIQFYADAQPTLETDPDRHVVADARVLYATETNALATCTLTSGTVAIGVATVRSVFISGEVTATHRPTEVLVKTPQTSLADLMSVRPTRNESAPTVLRQLPDPMVFNAVANVHGGIAAAGLELAAAAAISEATGYDDFRSGSLQVNFLRPFVAGGDSCYSGTAVHVGSSVSVADAEAIGQNGKVAVTARLTAYRPT
ncbi:hotdog fold thioesterase [Mycobacterium colombiense]